MSYTATVFTAQEIEMLEAYNNTFFENYGFTVELFKSSSNILNGVNNCRNELKQTKPLVTKGNDITYKYCTC